MKKKKVTAAELMAKLNSDPAFAVKRAREEVERRQRLAECRRAEAPLILALQRVGYTVDSVWDLVNGAAPYPSALPILFEHLARPYPGIVREGIARALAVPDARFGWNALTRLYRQEENDQVKDGLAVAIAAASDDEVIGDVIELARDARHGPSRLLLLRALDRSKAPYAESALVDLLRDPELAKEVEVILRRRRGRHRSRRRKPGGPDPE